METRLWLSTRPWEAVTVNNLNDGAANKPLLTALEKVQVESSKTPRADAIIAYRDHKEGEPRLEALAHHRAKPTDEAQFIAFERFQEEEEIYTDAEALELKEICQTADSILESSAPYSAGRARTRFEKLRDEHSVAIRAGENPGVLPSYKEVFKDSIHRTNICNQQLAELRKRSLPVEIAILKRFEDFTARRLRFIEEQEKEAASIMALVWEPSLEFRAVADVCLRYTVKNAMKNFGWRSPKTSLGAIVPEIFE